jgi:hypothetical protein
MPALAVAVASRNRSYIHLKTNEKYMDNLEDYYNKDYYNNKNYNENILIKKYNKLLNCINNFSCFKR